MAPPTIAIAMTTGGNPTSDRAIAMTTPGRSVAVQAMTGKLLISTGAIATMMPVGRSATATLASVIQGRTP